MADAGRSRLMLMRPYGGRPFCYLENSLGVYT